MRKLELAQNSEEWLDFRNHKIGASECAVIMGCSPSKTVYDLWREKNFGERGYINPAMMNGTRVEPLALHKFNCQYGTNYAPGCFLHDDRDWMMASFDGVQEDGSHIEIKCPYTEKSFEKLINGEIPQYYRWQLQHQLAISGQEFTRLVIYSDIKDIMVSKRVPRDEKMIESLLIFEEEFYQKYIVGFTTLEKPQKKRRSL